jgi:thiol-disulfide isomerase/thioredoxin
MTGLVVLVVVLVAATAFGVWRSRTAGRLSEPSPRQRRPSLGYEDIGHDLGERATLVQFSTAFCAPCRTTRHVLAHAAATANGVRHVEIDAESHLDLVRRLGVVRTPTTFVLDRQGQIVQRSTGVPRLAQISRVLDDIATT